MLWGTLGALVTLAALVVLVACPVANNGGGGPGTGGSTGQPYVCDNGTPSSLRDATADGLTRCASCNGGYTLVNSVCLLGYVCVNGVASDESADSAGQSRCVSCSPIATLDGTADRIGTTCRANVMLGEGVRIGMAVQFGEGESRPSGLAAIGNTLYMVGFTNDVLYTLDISDEDGSADNGMATQVGDTSAGFGVSETTPYALEAIGDTLYMVGWNQTVLYTLNTTTGRATLMSDAGVTNFGVGESRPTGLAAIGGTLYMIGEWTDALYTLNIDSTDMTPDGTAIQVGMATKFGTVTEGNPRGLAAIGGTLYMGGGANDVLYTLDTTTGRAAQVGSAPAGFDVGEDAPTGLAAIGNTLYMVGAANVALYALRYQ